MSDQLSAQYPIDSFQTRAIQLPTAPLHKYLNKHPQDFMNPKFISLFASTGRQRGGTQRDDEDLEVVATAIAWSSGRKRDRRIGQRRGSNFTYRWRGGGGRSDRRHHQLASRRRRLSKPETRQHPRYRIGINATQLIPFEHSSLCMRN
jgi:cation transport regulator ChaB